MIKHNYETLGALLKAIVDDGLEVVSKLGEKIYYDNSDEEIKEGNYQLSDFIGWDCWLIKPDWRDEVSPDNPVLCWVSDVVIEPNYESCAATIKVIEYNSDKSNPYFSGRASWKYATPVCPIKDNVRMSDD